MHAKIVKAFKKYHLFGFTGTPIFAKNAGRTTNPNFCTTEQAFGEKLHTYTIVNAIADKNVLPFRYEYVGRVDIASNVKDEKVYNIDEEKLFDNQIRISLITDYIIEHFSTKTKTSESYVYSTLDNVVDVAKKQNTEEIKSKKNINGFNSIFAVSSIKMAKEYYAEFKKQLEYKNSNLKVALIYSYGVNGEDGVIDENSESTEALSTDDRTFLDNAIKDYNNMFGTSYDTSSEKFQNYYKDVSLRMKNREIDILIVANMFLTGFDAKTLNTLWVDKNLKWHGLIQAFSRTNRILNSVKTYGNIVSFRNLEDRLNEALAKFGDEEAHGIVLLKPYNDYYYENGKSFEGYKSLVEKLTSKYTSGELMQSEAEQKEFIRLYGAILKVTNILSSFDEFKNDELLNERDKQDYHSIYIELYNEFRNKAKQERTDVTEDVVFEMELIKSIEVNIDYILGLVKKYHDSNMKDKEILVSIQKAIMASPDLRNKKDLIMAFIDSLDQDSNVYADFESFMNSKKKEELDKIIEEENLNKEEFIYKQIFEGNKRNVRRREIHRLLEHLPRQIARVLPLHHDHARIRAQPVIQLVVSHIHSVNACRARAQHHIRKAAGRRSHIQAYRTAHIDGEHVQRLLQLFRAPAHKGVQFSAHPDARFRLHALRRLLRALLAHKHAPFHDERARKLQAGRQAFLHQSFVDAHVSLHLA